MTSYYDLEKSTYQSVCGCPLAIIEGRPTDCKKELLKTEYKKINVNQNVDYDWSGG